MPIKRMNRLIVAITFVLLLAGAAMAKGPQDVAQTPHNLSSSSPVFMYAATNEDEVCIFCHTPHGGSLTGPLWNKNPTATVFTHYNSLTLSSYVNSSRGQNIYPESLLCLTCHDGSISMYNVMNFSNETGAQPYMDWNPTGQIMVGPGVPGPKIGDAIDPVGGGTKGVSNDLSDDHPISFFYEPVRADHSMKLKSISDAETAGARFFPGESALDADKRVECSSCHDPHVDYLSATGDEDYTPFLITPNSGSALCLACHNK